jgi:hypothetical protein
LALNSSSDHDAATSGSNFTKLITMLPEAS